MIIAVGLSNLQYVDLNSPRNLVIIGFSLFMGMLVPFWVENNEDLIDTGNRELANYMLYATATYNPIKLLYCA